MRLYAVRPLSSFPQALAPFFQEHWEKWQDEDKEERKRLTGEMDTLGKEVESNFVTLFKDYGSSRALIMSSTFNRTQLLQLQPMSQEEKLGMVYTNP